MITTSQLGLAPHIFNTAFPFHFALNRDLEIIQAGNVLQRIIPAMRIGSSLSDIFHITKPVVAADFDAIQAQSQSMFLLEACGLPLSLRGQMAYVAEEDILMFLGSPWVTNIGALQTLGLSLEDFALHDPMADLLMLLQAQTTALADSKKLTQKLTNQRAALRDANTKLETQYMVTRILAESDSVDEALPNVLRTIAEHLGWNIGIYWAIDQETTTLRYRASWGDTTVTSASIFQACAPLNFAPGVGLPGHVWSIGEGRWLSTATHTSEMWQASVAPTLDQGSAVALPIVTDTSTVGVMEFLSRAPRESDPETLQLLATLASQVGHFIERKHAEQEQKRLNDAIVQMQAAALAELSTPLIPINDEIVVMPLIGTIDSQRAQQIIDALLTGISASTARVAILDITGVSVIDTYVANALLRAAQGCRLVGAQVILTGMRPEVAQTVVGLGVDLRALITCSSLQNGIALAMSGRR